MRVPFKTGGAVGAEGAVMDGLVALALAALLLLVGIAHLVVPRKVAPLVPEWWPAPRATVLLSGVLEIALGIGLTLGDLRGPAAAAAALLFLGYTVVHLDDLRHVGAATRFSDRTPGVLLRGLTNLAYAACALYVAQGALA